MEVSSSMEARGGNTSRNGILADSTPKIIKCKKNGCKMCMDLSERPRIISTITGKQYLTKSSTPELKCQTENVIYLVTCKGCKVQYVGQTVQPLNKRFNNHRANIRNCKGASNSMVLSRHFSEGDCKGKEFDVQIVEKIAGNGRLGNGGINEDIRKFREHREEYWIKELQTVFPYGLNNRLEKNLEQRSIDDPVYNDLNSTQTRRRNRGSKSGEYTLTADEVWNRISIAPKESKISTALKLVPQMKKGELKALGLKNLDCELQETFMVRLKEIIDDRIRAKLANDRQHRRKVEEPKKDISHILKIKFVNKGFESLNLKSILKNNEVKDCIPENFQFKEAPVIVFKYGKTIRSRIFNYKKVFEDFNVNRWRQERDNVHCNCANSEFKDVDHGHVITGDLRIVKNGKLRKLLCKGPNFRENEMINFEKVLNEIKIGLDEYTVKWCKKENVNKTCLEEWKSCVIQKVQERIAFLKSDKFKFITTPRKVLQNKDAKEELERLHKDFVMVPTDKASNNVSFICKKFYIEKILEETGQNTYERINENENVVVNRLCDIAVNRYKFNLVNEDKVLPKIYMMPKMHKNPTGFRFIIASKQNPLKKTAKTLTKILKVIMDTHFAYNRKIRLYTGINRMWICQNNAEILKEIEKVNNRNGARNVDSFDFSTLYTKINLEDLAEKLKHCIRIAFKGGNNQKITVGRYHTKWGNYVKGHSYTKEEIFQMVDDIIFNAFFSVGDEVFRQIVGIPMGVDPAPFMANLYLYCYEFDMMEKLTKEDRGIALKFNKTFRFIDDLIDLNNDGMMEKMWNKIYPKELVLKKENIGNKSTTFLDLKIDVEDKKFITKLYDKRDNFNFDIVSFPDLSGNIPSVPAYGVFTAQVLRIFRASSRLSDANVRIAQLAGKLVRQGYDKFKLIRSAKRMFPKHNWILHKYNISMEQLLKTWKETWIWIIDGS